MIPQAYQIVITHWPHHNSSSLLLAMGKVAKTTKPAADAQVTASDAAKADSTAHDKKDISNFITQLKSAKASDAQKQVLQLYQQLPRYSDRKKELLCKWKNDKSCAWVSTYEESHKRSVESEQSRVDGHGAVS